MNEIKCPHCKKVFKADEAGFADIVKQVRENELEKELSAQKAWLDAEKNTAIEMAKSKTKEALQNDIANKDKKIAELETKLNSASNETALAILQATTKIEKERDLLKSEIQLRDAKKQIELQAKDEQIAYYKDLKAKLSTKLVGESLEKHCETEFNKARHIGFQKAVFGKDNDAKTGSKGDYIYKENDDNGNEILSIMFEMKNEEDGTSTKKKNEDFLNKLDKDRTAKKCEYAVLVSMLEPEDEFFNVGIVDMSHHYPKMYVIRPQFFIQIISLLRNAALNSMKYKSELAIIKSQNIDITNFEDDLNDFKVAFGKNANAFSGKISDALEKLEKQKKQIQDIIDLFKGGQKQLDWAGDKLENLSVKKLTKNNPTMAAKFEEARVPKK